MKKLLLGLLVTSFLSSSAFASQKQYKIQCHGATSVMHGAISTSGPEMHSFDLPERAFDPMDPYSGKTTVRVDKEFEIEGHSMEVTAFFIYNKNGTGGGNVWIRDNTSKLAAHGQGRLDHNLKDEEVYASLHQELKNAENAPIGGLEVRLRCSVKPVSL